MNALNNGQMIRLLTFNLHHGGGDRIGRIAELVLSHEPDIAILTEYRISTGLVLSAALTAGGLIHQISSSPPPRQNGVFVATRLPFKPVTEVRYPCPSPRHWLEVEFEGFQLGAIYLGVRSEEYPLFLNWLVDLVNRRRLGSFILAGDFNWLERGDGGNEEPGMVEELSAAGYADAWRRLDPTGREYSWTNHNGTRTRVDYAFLSKRVAGRLAAAWYAHDGREAEVSDHCPLVVDLVRVPVRRFEILRKRP